MPDIQQITDLVERMNRRRERTRIALTVIQFATAVPCAVLTIILLFVPGARIAATITGAAALVSTALTIYFVRAGRTTTERKC